jgi:hypothetical protein
VNDSVVCKYKPRQAATVCLGWNVFVSTNGWIRRQPYRSLNALLAQRKNCHMELLLRLSYKTEQLHSTILAHCLSKHTALDAITVGCSCCMFEPNRSINSKWPFLRLCLYYIQLPISSIPLWCHTVSWIKWINISFGCPTHSATQVCVQYSKIFQYCT